MRRVVLISVLAVLWPVASARAGEVNLWACHGPDGGPLSSAPFNPVVFAGDSEIVAGCTVAGDALRAHFVRTDPQGASSASLRLDAPPGVAVTELRIKRTAKGPGYAATGAGGATFESTATTLTTDLDMVTNSPFVRIGVTCAAGLGQRCADDAAYVDVRSVEFTAIDASSPQLAVGGVHSPAAGVLNVDVPATDAGTGLARADLVLDGATVATAGFGCGELSPADGTHDLALGALCPATGRATIDVDTTKVADGDHTLVVKVLDAAGNVAQSSPQTVTVRNGTPTPTATASPTPTPTAIPAPAVLAAPTPTASPVPAAHCAVSLPKRLSVSTSVSVTVSCLGVAAPATLRLTAPGRTLATGTVAPGYRGKLTLKLTSAARAALRKHKTLKATLTLYEGRAKRPGVAVTLSRR